MNNLTRIKPHVFSPNPALKFNRKDQVLLTRTRIGHTRLTDQHIFNKEEKHKCTTCNLPTSVKHVLRDSPSHNKERKSHRLQRHLTEILNNP